MKKEVAKLNAQIVILQNELEEMENTYEEAKYKVYTEMDKLAYKVHKLIS